MSRTPLVATFSIVARDAENGNLGVAVASKFLAVGSVVPWARAGVGAVAIQAFANTTYGPEGLALLDEGMTAPEVVNKLIDNDSESAHRQVGIVGADGSAATHTGTECHPWAGGIAGEGFAAQGNILTGAGVIDAMAAALTSSSGSLAERLFSALETGDHAGGDSRGRQSAALLIVRSSGGYGGRNDRFLDLRVDDHTDPIGELRRLMTLHSLYFERPDSRDAITITEEIAVELQSLLRKAGEPPGDSSGFYDEETRSALARVYGRENLEERWLDGAVIDRIALDYLRQAIRVNYTAAGSAAARTD